MIARWSSSAPRSGAPSIRVARSASRSARRVAPADSSASASDIRASASRCGSPRRPARTARSRCATAVSASSSSSAAMPSARCAAAAAPASGPARPQRLAGERAGALRIVDDDAVGLRRERGRRAVVRQSGSHGVATARDPTRQRRLTVPARHPARDEAALRVGLHLGHPAGVPDLDPRRRGRVELPGQRALGPLPRHLELDRQAVPAEAQHPRAGLRAHPGGVLARVVQQLGQLVVDRAPVERQLGRRHDVVRDRDRRRPSPGAAPRAASRRRRSASRPPRLVGQASSGAAVIPATASLRRSCSRHRARVGPMLPIGMSSAAPTSS